MERQPCVYILASGKRRTLYIGVTSNVLKRIWEHRNDVVEGFTKEYGVHSLVWLECHPTMESAITRETALKSWHRGWKLRLIENANPEWRDIYDELVSGSFNMDSGLRRNDSTYWSCSHRAELGRAGHCAGAAHFACGRPRCNGFDPELERMDTAATDTTDRNPRASVQGAGASCGLQATT